VDPNGRIQVAPGSRFYPPSSCASTSPAGFSRNSTTAPNAAR